MRAALLFLGLFLFLVASPSASAQAALASAHPAPNGHVDAGGSAYVELRFTQTIERAHTTIEVLGVVDAASRIAGPLQIDTEEPNVARVPLTPLADGYYSVSWSTLSPDAQTARGTYVFAAGNASVKFAAPAQARDASETPPALVAREGFARAVATLGVAFAVGIPLFTLVTRSADEPRRALAVAAAFAALGALASVLSLIFLAQRAHLTLDEARATLAGRLILARAVALGAAAAALALAAWRRQAAPLALLVGGAALVATVMGSRAAWLADERALSAGAEVALLAGLALAAGATFGALLRKPSPANPAAPLMMSGLVLVALAVTFAGLRDVPQPRDIIGSTHGLGVFALAVALGMAYAFRAARRVPIAAVAVVVMVGAAGLIAAAPAPDRPVLAADASSAGPPVLELANQSRTTHVVLDAAPAPIRANATGQRLDIALHPLTTSDIPPETRVFLALTSPDGATRDVPLVARSGAEWSTGEATFFTMPGAWHVDVTIQRPDESATLGFEVLVETPTIPEVPT